MCTPTEIRLLDEYKLVQLKKTQEKDKKEDGIKKRDELNSQQVDQIARAPYPTLALYSW